MIRFNRTSLLIAALFAAAPAVHAAGFQLSEQSIVGLGRAHAGAGVAGDDLSAVFYNPAGMMLLNGTQVQGGFTYAEIDAPFEGTSTTGKRFSDNGRAGGEAIPNAFFVKEINERTRFGFGVTVPFGLGSGYGEDWGGRSGGIEAHVMTVDFNPSLAYQLDDKWSIGGGVSAQYTKANLKKGDKADIPNVGTFNASGEIEADSWDYGYNLGLMYQFDADSRVGLSYRSKIQHETEGDFTKEVADLNVSKVYHGSTNVTTPESILLSGYHRIDPKLALTGSLRWSNWSRFDVLDIKSNGTTASTINNNWKASWFASLGADYNYSDKLTLRGGVAYETSPVPDAEHRNPLIPDTDRVWLSLGG
ncbi:OmpP1/FadL family transporter, partial [Craterilacuibacter sp.]|uniref:OmpP1/FadL family transporter n=1 Tax=Craterilacuibacter sp. TaxID=2870909 RepID=UPI003F387435